jgi:hypothetical protein
MNFKLAVYVECPTCGGSGVVKGMFRSFVDCKGYNCINGYVTVLVTREEMNSLLGGETTIDGDPRSFAVKPLRTASGRPIPGRT